MRIQIQLLVVFCAATLALAAFTDSAVERPTLEEAAVAAVPGGDEILRVARSGYLTRALPQGPDRPGISEFSEDIDELTAMPDGRLLAITSRSAAPAEGLLMYLNEVGPGGELHLLHEVARPGAGEAAYPLDLKADRTGRLYLLTEIRRAGDSEPSTRLLELDPDDGATLRSVRLVNRVAAIAAAPAGFWAIASGRLRTLDPSSGRLSGPSFSLADHLPVDMDVDSSGALWLWEEGVCSPPCPFLTRFDPATHSFAAGGGDLVALLQDVTIRRRCTESETVRCLQGGRFRAELTWSDFAGQQGSGKVASGRSADTGLFYFFEKKNWELMVKVLNGCAENGHFWVYSSASTTVAFTLKVTDLETGTERVYSNPLGQLATTITDSHAFACPSQP